MPFSNPITAGGILVQPSIQSPNFSIAGQSGWAVDVNGNAYFFNVTLAGDVIIASSTGAVLVYSGPPSLGNLIGSWAGQGGTDTYGNAYTAGLTVGAVGTSDIELVPNINQQFNITTLIAGTFQAMAQFNTSDSNQTMPSMFGSVLLGSGTTTKMTSVFHSPIPGGSAAMVVLESQNDAGTDTPDISFGTVSMPDGVTMVFSPIATLTPYAFLLYSGASGQASVTKTTGSGTIPIPAGVTTALAETWGAGGGGATLGGGAGGGEYAAEPTLAVTGGGTVAYAVGAAGTGSSSGSGTAGGNSTLTGTSVTVTGHGGARGTPLASGAGGTGSTNTTHHNGGAGGNVTSATGGSGGGSSAGPAAAGGKGGTPSGNTGGAGGNAPTGGGAGGQGGSGSTSGSGSPGNGSAGSAPGGGGGGGGFDSATTISGTGGNGAKGQVRITYTTGAPTILASIATASGTDQFGTSYNAGFNISMAAAAGQIVSVTNTTSGPSNSSLLLTAAASGDNLLGLRVSGDADNRLKVTSAGTMLWGPGGSTTQDTQLSRLSPARLAQIDVGSNSLTTPGSRIGAVSAGTLGASTIVGSITIPASDIVANAIYRLVTYGSASWGTTQESMTFTGSFGGQSVGAQTLAATDFVVSGVLRWKVEVVVACLTSGSSGTATGAVDGCVSIVGTNLNPGTTASNTVPFAGAAGTITVNTTIANILSLVVSWGGAFGSVTGNFCFLERIA